MKMLAIFKPQELRAGNTLESKKVINSAGKRYVFLPSATLEGDVEASSQRIAIFHGHRGSTSRCREEGVGGITYLGNTTKW
jgi:hypothetical protein